MVSAETISDMLKELGPLIDAAGIWLDDGEGMWTIALNESTIITVLADHQSNTLRLEADIGPLAGAGIDTMPLLLAFNDYPAGRHGIWMSLDDTGETAVQAMTIGIDGMTGEKLKSGIEQFHKRLRTWRETIPAGAMGDEVSPKQSAEDEPASGQEPQGPADEPSDPYALFRPGIMRG